MPLPRDRGAVQRGSCVPLVLGREVVDIDTGETFVAVGITVDAEGLLAAVSTWRGAAGACAMGRTAAGHVDHVVLGVRDLDATAERLHREYGFHAGDRAVVDGTGWANRGIPLGRGNYLELLAVDDPTTPGGAALAELVRNGDRWLAWAVCLDDLEAVAVRAGVPATPGSRGGSDRPGWWTVQADPAHTTNGFLPFFITYRRGVDTSHLDPRHTGPAATVDGIATLELTGPGPDPITAWIGFLPPGVRISDGPPGIRAVVVRTADGSLRLE